MLSWPIRSILRQIEQEIKNYVRRSSGSTEPWPVKIGSSTYKKQVGLPPSLISSVLLPATIVINTRTATFKPRTGAQEPSCATTVQPLHKRPGSVVEQGMSGGGAKEQRWQDRGKRQRTRGLRRKEWLAAGWCRSTGMVGWGYLLLCG
jgi:hypothetical protein